MCDLPAADVEVLDVAWEMMVRLPIGKLARMSAPGRMPWSSCGDFRIATPGTWRNMMAYSHALMFMGMMGIR